MSTNTSILKTSAFKSYQKWSGGVVHWSSLLLTSCRANCTCPCAVSTDC